MVLGDPLCTGHVILRMRNEHCSLDIRDFWSEVKRIRRNRTFFSDCVDSAFNPTDIVNIFADKYQELYTAVAYNADDMVCLKNKIADSVSTVGYNSHCSVSCEEVLFAVCKCKPGKDGGDIGVLVTFCMHVMNYQFTSLCFSHVAQHMMNLSTVLPIPKGKNVCLSDSSNYRGIALSLREVI